MFIHTVDLHHFMPMTLADGHKVIQNLNLLGSFLVHMSIICNKLCSPSWHGKNFNVGYYMQTVNFFIPAIDFYHFVTAFTDLDLAWEHKFSEKQNLGVSFSQTLFI